MPATTSQPEPPAWDVDADWWGPAWDVVQPVGPAEPARPGKPRDVTPSAASALSVAYLAADPPAPGPEASLQEAADPSWGQILATTISLWVSRRSPGASLGRRHDADAPDPPAPGSPTSGSRDADAADSPASGPPASGPPASGSLARRPRDADAAGSPARRPRVAGWASAVWGAHARLLSAAVLSAGLLAAGAGAVGLVATHPWSGPSQRLVAKPSPVAAPTGHAVAPVSVAAAAPPPKPVLLTIPAIGVKAPIITLGLNRNGTLQVPKTTTVVGWYTNSPRPGAIGSAIIAGHVDSRSGPGVFFWLRAMHPGERIYVRRADGTLAVFTVTVVRLYAKSQFPTAMVYGPVPDAELRLITCGGTFDYATGSYLSNVVVYARLSS
jgi:sortase (surface protein transpeptidase)